MAVVALAISIVCFIATYSAVGVALKLSRKERDFRALILLFQELEDNHEALAASHKRLRARVGMRELRAKRKNGQNGEDTEAPVATAETDKERWKREMRVKLHRGELKP